jgi:hypothetical protein
MGIKSIVIIGRQWFRKSAGNSYQTAQIVVDGRLVHTMPQSCQYGDHYVYEAFKWLGEHGHIEPMLRHANGSTGSPWDHARELGITLFYTVVQVECERDL